MPDLEALPTAVDFAHDIAQRRVAEGDVVIDATMGNGHDTLFLAQLVGPSGRVFAFDVQQAAIASTEQRLLAASVRERCVLVHDGHQHFPQYLPGELRGRLATVMFNLGWLPGHDKTCITRTETTLVAIAAALEWLRPGGVLLIVVYPGHAGGGDESLAVAELACALPSNTHEVRHLRPGNRLGKSPECWAIRVRPPQ